MHVLLASAFKADVHAGRESRRPWGVRLPTANGYSNEIASPANREQTDLVTHPNILVIEDDVQLQTTIEAALEEEGLEPAIAATGEEAVTLLKSDSSDYRALVVDIRLLGRIDGWEVARAARRVDPNVPVVYITGAEVDRWEAQGVPRSVLLRKPFASAELVTVIQRLLAERSGAER